MGGSVHRESTASRDSFEESTGDKGGSGSCSSEELGKWSCEDAFACRFIRDPRRIFDLSLCWRGAAEDVRNALPFADWYGKRRKH
jgi:hypothetical protein